MGWGGEEIPEEACHVKEAIYFKRKVDYPYLEHVVNHTHILHVYATYASSSKIEARENLKGLSLGWGEVGEEASSCEEVDCLFG